MIRNTCPKAGTFSEEATEAPAVEDAEPADAAAAARTNAKPSPRPILVRMGQARLSADDSCSAVTVCLSEPEALKQVADIAAAVPRRSRRSRGISVRRVVIGTGGSGVEPVVDRCQGRQAEDGFDELQDRAVLIQRRLKVRLLGK